MQTVTEDCGVMLQLTEQEIKDFVVDKLQANPEYEFVSGTNNGHQEECVPKKYRLLQIYPKYCLMIDQNGLKESFTYADLFVRFGGGEENGRVREEAC
ncbi:MAG: hypothetical protein [Bacteriophage sp.]|nr:MAG: hypothetical protein [Bacteriophage sp.]